MTDGARTDTVRTARIDPAQSRNENASLCVSEYDGSPQGGPRHHLEDPTTTTHGPTSSATAAPVAAPVSMAHLEQFTEAVLHAPQTRPGRYTILEYLNLDKGETRKAVEEYVQAHGG